MGKHYQLITVLAASPAFSSDSPAKRKLSFSPAFCVNVWCVCEPSPAGCCPRVCRASSALRCSSLCVRRTAAESPHMAKEGLSPPLRIICSKLQSFSPPTHPPTTHTKRRGCQSCYRKPRALLLTESPHLSLFCTSHRPNSSIIIITQP